jgi:hypothetical protein
VACVTETGNVSKVWLEKWKEMSCDMPCHGYSVSSILKYVWKEVPLSQKKKKKKNL